MRGLLPMAIGRRAGPSQLPAVICFVADQAFQCFASPGRGALKNRDTVIPNRRPESSLSASTAPLRRTRAHRERLWLFEYRLSWINVGEFEKTNEL